MLAAFYAVGHWRLRRTLANDIPPTDPAGPRAIHADKVMNSVRSREGRRNRAPPPRVRYNKDGKKVTPTQGAKTT